MKHRSGSAKGTRAMVSGGKSSITIPGRRDKGDRPGLGSPAIQVGGELESSRSESVIGVAPNNSRHRMSFSRR